MENHNYGCLSFAAGGRLVFGGQDACDFKSDKLYAKFKAEFPDYEKLLWEDSVYDKANRGVTPSGMEYYVIHVGHQFSAIPLDNAIENVEVYWTTRQSTRFYEFHHTLHKNDVIELAHLVLCNMLKTNGLRSLLYHIVERSGEFVINTITTLCGDIFVNAWYSAALRANRGDEGYVAPSLLDVVETCEIVYGRHAAMWDVYTGKNPVRFDKLKRRYALTAEVIDCDYGPFDVYNIVVRRVNAIDASKLKAADADRVMKARGTLGTLEENIDYAIRQRSFNIHRSDSDPSPEDVDKLFRVMVNSFYETAGFNIAILPDVVGMAEKWLSDNLGGIDDIRLHAAPRRVPAGFQ